MLLQEDLKQIASEYKSYFPVISLVEKDQKILSTIGHIELETLEGKKLSISVSERGWFILGSNKYYDTFEALMNTHSAGFRDTFANDLFDKLLKIAGQKETSF